MARSGDRTQAVPGRCTQLQSMGGLWSLTTRPRLYGLLRSMPLQPFARGLLAEAVCPEDVKGGCPNGSYLVCAVQVSLASTRRCARHGPGLLLVPDAHHVFAGLASHTILAKNTFPGSEPIRRI